MIKPEKIIIIGGNAAGPAAAAKAKRINPSASVILFEAGDYISTGTCEIPYVLSGDIKDYNDIIFFSPQKFKEEKGVDVFVNHLVEEIHTKEKYIIVNNFNDNKKLKFDYDSLVIATGSKPKIIPSLPPTLTNVFCLTKIQDLINVQEYLKKNEVKNIGIVGAGYIGLETADALYDLGYNVTLIEKEKLPLPLTEPELQYLILDELKKKNISFYGGFTKMKVNYDEDKAASVNIDGRIIEFDLIITAAGFIPNAGLAVQANLKLGKFGGIKTDRKLKTSDQNIFSAGDCIEVINAVTNQYDYIPLSTIAHLYAHTAGENAAGGNKVVDPVVKNSAIKIFNRYTVTVGLTSREAKVNNFLFDSVYESANSLVEVMPESKKNYGKIIYEKKSKRILGASFFGGSEVAGFGDIISALIIAKQPADFLAEINYNYTPPLSPFKNLLSILGRKVN